MRLKFTKFITLLALCLIAMSSTVWSQTMMPLPPHSSVYSGSVRGYWFTAPISFTITGLRVPSQAGTGTQNIHVMKINDPVPVVFAAQSTNFNTLAYINNAPNGVIQTVNIQVNAGDIIGILGQAGTSNSYGSVTGPSSIGGFPVTLTRLLYQGNINVSQAPWYSTEPSSSSISRVEMYYIIGGTGMNNAGVSQLVAPTNFCAGIDTVKVKVKNFGSNIINNVQVQWSMNGIAQTPVSLNTPLDTPGSSGVNEVTVTLGTYNFTNAPVLLKAWTTLPNGQADTINSNDTLTQTLQSSLSGTYTINNALPTGGTNYNSFTAFANDLNTYGVCGPVTANVAVGSGPYVETVTFENIPGASAVNKIRINGNGRTVQYNNTSTLRQLLTLDGTKYLAIDSLTFKSLNSSYGWGALITGGSEYDSLTRCTFDLTSVTGSSSVNSNGITFSGSNTSATSSGSNGSNCYIAKNKILGRTGSGGPYYGFTLYGDNNNNVIKDNLIQNFYIYGFYNYGGSDNLIDGNEITRKTKTSVTTFYGMYLSTGTPAGIIVRNNRIHTPFGGTGTSTSTFYGIYNFFDGTASNPAYFYNNAVYNVNQGGTVYGFYGSTVEQNKIYHNTIDLGVNLSSSSTNYGIYLAGTNTGTTVKNNVVTITGGGTGTKYGFYYSSASSVNDPQRNNIYVNSSQSGTQYYGYYGGAYATMAAFQAANPTLEVGSVSIDPQYVNAAAGNLAPDNPLMIATGTNLMAIVPNDIVGLPRTALPTVGAFEKPPYGSNNAGTIALVKPQGNLCPGLQPVSAAIMNGGINTINNVTVNWSVNGVVQTPVVHNTPLYITTSGQQFMDTVSLGTFNLPATGIVTLKIWTSNPNGSADNYNYNDTLISEISAADFQVSANLDTICAGNTLILNLQPGTGYLAGNLIWQTSLNGTAWTNITNTDSTVHTVNGLNTDRYYRVRIQNELVSCFSDSQKIIFTDPQMVYWNDTSRCGPGEVTFDAEGGYGSTLKWYDAATGGQLLTTGNSFTTPPLTANTDYWVSAGLGVGGASDSVNVPLSVGTTTGVYHHMFLAQSTTGALITEIGIKCSNPLGAMTAWDIYYRPDNYQLVAGANTSSTGWTLLASTSNVPSMGTGAYTTIATGLSLSIPSGSTFSFYIAPASGTMHQYGTMAAGTNVVTTPELTIKAGHRGSSLFNCNTSSGIAVVNFKLGANCESDRKKVTAIIHPVPEVNLGADIDTCIAEGTTFNLDAGTQPNNAIFLWDNNSTQQTRSVGQSGTYHVDVTNQFGCMDQDTINIVMKWNPEVDLGANGKNLCIGGTKVLDAGPDGQNGGNYYWNTGATSQTITVTSGGTYIAYVTSHEGCLTIDTVTIIENGYMPTVDAIITQPTGQFSFQFSALNPQHVVTYLWDFGDGNTSTAPSPSHTYAAAGDYVVKLKVFSICGDIIDSSTVHILTTGVKDLDDNKLVQVYPNPNNGSILFIETKGDVKVDDIAIFNNIGQEIIKVNHFDNTHKHKINLPASLASGVYHIRIHTNKGATTKKLDIVK